MSWNNFSTDINFIYFEKLIFKNDGCEVKLI